MADCDKGLQVAYNDIEMGVRYLGDEKRAQPVCCEDPPKTQLRMTYGPRVEGFAKRNRE